MSIQYTRSNETDSYEVLTSYNSTQSQQEELIVSSLVKGLSNPAGNNTTIPVEGNQNWDYKKLSSQYVNTSTLYNTPAGSVTQNSAISLEHVAPEAPQKYTISLNVDSTKDLTKFEMLGSSVAYYDSNVAFTNSYPSKHYDAASESASNFSAEFDHTNSNAHVHYSRNSALNSKLGPWIGLNDFGTSPIGVTEDVEFNTTKALGQMGTSTGGYTSYYAVSGGAGGVGFLPVDNLYQPLTNNLDVVDRGVVTAYTAGADIGIYKYVQSTDNSVAVTITAGSEAQLSTAKLPIIDANLVSVVESTTKQDVLLPASLTTAQFNGFFNEPVLNTVADGYEFTVSGTENTVPSGYFLPTDQTLFTAFDNSNILDNVCYMQNHVDKSHKLVLSPSTLVINPAGDAAQGNVDSIAVDLTIGEKLPADLAGVDGGIFVQTNTKTTRTPDATFQSMTGSVPGDISVSYANESTTNHINTIMEQNPYLHVSCTKVALKTKNEPDANVFLRSNDAFLSLYTNQPVNNIVDKTGTTFNFNNSLFNDDKARVWQVNAENILVAEPDSFYEDEVSLGTLVNGIKVSSTLRNLTENSLDYDEYRNKLTAKTLSQLSLNAAVAATSNWSIGYSGVNDTFLHSSSVAAYGGEGSMPKYSPDLIQALATGATIPYTYEYMTGQSSEDYSGIKDYVQVTYIVGTVPVTSTIQQKGIKRTYTARGTPSCTVVAENDYTFTGGNYTKDEFEFVSVTRASTLTVSFEPCFSIFTNITLAITGIQQNDTYHAIRNKSSGVLVGHRELKHVSCSVTNFRTIHETITPVSDGTFTISGQISVNDLKGFMGVVEAKRNLPGAVNDNTWEVISSPSVDFDTYFGLDNIQTLSLITTTSSTSPDVSTKIEYDPFGDDQEDVTLTHRHYFIPLVYDANDAHYTVSSFTGGNDATSGLSNVNDGATFFTPTDNYAASVKAFVKNGDYTVSVSNTANVTTISVWKNILGQMILVFEIKKQGHRIFLGCHTVAYTPTDIWYAKMSYGQTSTPVSSIEGLFATTYPNNLMSCPGVAPGVVINVRSQTFPAGCMVSSRILSDYVAVNPVHTLSWNALPTHINELGFNYNLGSLEFKYNSGTYYSAKVTLPKYRGYNSGTNPGAVQAYSISRGKTIATFTVGDVLSQVLTSNMYAGQVLTVNQLKTNGGIHFANLNITITAQYSIVPSNSLLTYDVTLVADEVTVTITNSSYVGGLENISVPTTATPVANPTQYSASSNLMIPPRPPGLRSVYTFSAAKPVSIASSRIKLRNSEFPHGSFTYKIKLSLPDSMLYKAIAPADSQSFLGNPAMISDDTKWGLVATLSGPVDKRAGFVLGRKRISQSPIKYAKGGITYYTAAPPQYIYESVIATSDLPTTYDWPTLQTKNKGTVKLSYDGTASVFQPFATTYTIKGVNGNNVIITNDSVTTNNITYTHLKAKSLKELVEMPISQRFGIHVGGVNLKIELHSGLGDSISRPHSVFDGQISSLPTGYAIGNTHIVFDGRDNDGSVNFSIAQYAEDAGYPSDTSGYQKIFKTTVQQNYYNLNFKMANPCWKDKTQSTVKFNAAAEGIRPTLYTVIDVNDPMTRVNSRRLFKYPSAATYKIDDSTNSIQASNFSFTLGRSYYDIVVNQPPFSTDPNYIWDYSTLLANTVVTPGTITWTPDTDFNQTNTDVSIGWVYGNSVTAEKMPIELLYVDDTARKCFLMTLLPSQIYKNQYGLTNAQIAWDGSLYSPLLSTKTVSFQPQAQFQNISTTYQVEQYSITSNPK